MDVVASSITIGALAVNIANSVVKLKNCWDSIQDAPEDVQFLIERVELLSQILRDIEDDQTQNSVSSKLLDDSTASKCLKTCKAAADRLAQLTEQMATSIDTSRQLKRKWICAKVVLKKDKVLKFEKELQSCISLLQLSHETYTRSLLRLQPEIIYAKVVQAVSSGAFQISNSIQDRQTDSAVASTSSPVTVSRPQSSGYQAYNSFWQSTSALDILGNLCFRTRYYKKRKLIGIDNVEDSEVHQELRAQYRLPRWLANQAWDFCAKKAYNGWDFQLRQYVIIPLDSLPFQYIVKKNVKGLQELFSKRELSPWSCDGWGWTLLHTAFLDYDATICRLLLDLGADPMYQTNNGWSAIKVDIGLSANERSDRSHWSRANLHDTGMIELSHHFGKPEGWGGLQQYWFPDYYETPLEERFQVAAGLAEANPWEPASFRLALSRNCIPRLAVHMRDRDGWTLVHIIAWVIGRLTSFSRDDRMGEDFEGWRLVLREIITLGADLHPIDRNSYTPLLRVLIGFIHACDPSPPSELPIDRGLDRWLYFLESCGVNLCEYGKREEELHERGLVKNKTEVIRWDNAIAMVTLGGFTYGSSPGEWVIKMEYQRLDPNDDSGQDPNQDPDQVEEMPGGWIED